MVMMSRMRMIMMTLVSGGQRAQVGVSQWAVCSFCRPPIHGHRSQDCLSVIIRMIIVITIVIINIIIIISFADRMVIAPRIFFPSNMMKMIIFINATMITIELFVVVSIPICVKVCSCNFVCPCILYKSNIWIFVCQCKNICKSCLLV